MSQDENVKNSVAEDGGPPRIPPVMPPHPHAGSPPPWPPSSGVQRSSKGRKWIIGCLVVIGLILVIGLGEIASRFVTFTGTRVEEAGPEFNEVVLERNQADSKLLVVDIQGLIGNGFWGDEEYDMAEQVRRQLKRAERDHKIRSVILRIDSPGGEVLTADEISRDIADFQKRTGKPVVASMGSLAASGGYYVAVPCRWIVAHELTLTGSIGVMLHGYNYRGLMNKVGVRPEVYKSGRFKDMMSPDRAEDEIDPEERRMLQAIVDETFERFKAVVAEGRKNAHRLNNPEGKALAANWIDYADGRVFSGKQAYELGFVDELGNFRTAVKRALKLTGLERANIVQFRQRRSILRWLDLLGKNETPSLQLNFGVDLPRLRPGKLYYLFLPGIR